MHALSPKIVESLKIFFSRTMSAGGKQKALSFFVVDIFLIMLQRFWRYRKLPIQY
jgi:hypothetical protein